jgi:hypothetical protein
MLASGVRASLAVACRNSLMGNGAQSSDGVSPCRGVSRCRCCSLLLPNEDTHASRPAARVLGPRLFLFLFLCYLIAKATPNTFITTQAMVNT